MKFRSAAAAVALSAAAIGTTAVVAPSADAATGCPSGAVCIRESNGSILSKNIFYSYGAHNLSNVTGNHVIVNNQTGGAGFELCKSYGGTNCLGVVRYRGEYASYNFTPINSVRLVK